MISWPAGIASRGEVRNQYHHAVDIVPTILECAGIEMPEQVLGYEQTPLPGVSMKYTFEADGPTQKHVQYYEMMGTRALWHDAGTSSPSARPSRAGRPRTWSTTPGSSTTPRSTGPTHDLADQHPDKVKELVNLWYVEAGKYDVLPLDNRSLADLVKAQPVADIPAGGVYRYYPNTSPVPEFAAAEIRGRSFKILADVEITDEHATGVLLANGARFGGHSLFLKDGKLWYVNNFLGIPPEQVLSAPEGVTAGRHVLGAEFVKESHGDHGEAIGTATLYVDDQAVAKGRGRRSRATSRSVARASASDATAGIRCRRSTNRRTPSSAR